MRKENWTYKKLGEVAYYPSKRIATKDLKSFSFVGVENLIKNKGGVSFSESLPNIDTAIEYQKDDILIGNIRPYLKKIWKADNNGGASGDVVIVRINKEYACLLDAKYLYKVLSTDYFFDYDNSNTKGAKMPRGDRKVIAKYIIPIPPLATQSRIVSELDLLQSIIDKQKAQVKELDNLAQAIFYDMFGDPVENEKGWEVKKMGDVAPAVEYKGKHPQIANKYWLLNLDKVEAQTGRILSIDYYDYEEIGNSVVSFDKTNVLYSKLRPYLNKVVVPTQIGYATSELVPLQPNASLLDRQYIAYMLRSKLFVDYISGKVAGAKMPRVTMSVFREFRVPVPPFPLQQSFAQKVESIERQKELINQSIREAQTLFDSRMEYYFGE